MELEGFMDMETRKVTAKDDFEAIGNIYSCSWKSAYQGIVPQSYLDELSGSRWSSVSVDSQYDAYVIMDKEKYAGTSSICAARDEKMMGWGEIISIYLLPEYFGKGYAKPLLDCAVNALVGKGYKSIYLWVLDYNIRAQKFYEKHGFEKNGDAASLTIGGKELTEIRYIKHLHRLTTFTG